MPLSKMWLTALGIASLAACAGDGPRGPRPDPDPGPLWAPIDEHDELGASIAAALDAIADVSPEVRVLAHRLRQPLSAVLDADPSVESCQAVEDALWTACNAVGRPCWATATFYWAHDMPRCTARLELEDDYEDALFSDLYVVDFAGASRANPSPACGNGALEEGEGETCDDGNLEPWDGCDPDCQTEPFDGCETVIQQEFSAAEVAWIDATTWQSPRSHLMIHNDVQPFGAVDGAVCDRASQAATATCARLSSEMPFVSWCTPEVHMGASACDVRLRVQFVTPDPTHGVFTTALQGVLAFTVQ